SSTRFQVPNTSSCRVAVTVLRLSNRSSSWQRSRNSSASKSAQRVENGLGNASGSFLATVLHRLDAAGVSLVDCVLDALRGVRRPLLIMFIRKHIQHHSRG